MANTATQAIQAPPSNTPNPNINIAIGADTFLVIAGIAWFAWEKLFKPKVVSKLDSAFTPVEEERRLGCILSQIGAVTRASRVILAAFHNGQIDSHGYHLTKISTVNAYTAPGGVPMAKPIRDLPLGRIIYELEELMKTKELEYTITEYKEELPQACRDHLTENKIGRMYNRLIRIGNLPIGILSVQYHENTDMDELIIGEPYCVLLDTLYHEIAAVMRRRVIHPNRLKQVIMMMIKCGKK